MDYSDRLLEAFNEFLEEDYKLAEKAGYYLETSVTSDGKLFLEADTTYEDLPNIDIYVKEDRSYEGTFILEVDVEFPEINWKSDYVSFTDYLDAWKDAAELVDDLKSIRFDPKDWLHEDED